MDGGDSNRFDIGFSTQVTRHQRIDVAFSGPRSGRLEVRLQFESRPIRATTSVRRQGGAVVWSQSASGSLAVDPHRARVTASGRPLVGRGGVSVRFFLDENGNGRLDSGEERVAGAVTRFDRMAVFRSSHPGEVIATDLLAYHRYHAEVDTRLVPNPLWRPQFTSFSFVADPNRFQTIEIPFYTAGTAQGMVVRRVDSAERPVAGLKVLVSSADGSVLEVISTFADGSFYHEGLPPGRYIVRLDAAQLDILGVTSHPSERVVDLQPGRDGVSIEGLDFLLLPRTDGASQ